MTRKTVLVTGGAKRIGAAICRRFAAAGWHVVIHCHRSLDAAQALAGELGDAEVAACDLADGAAVRRLAREMASRHENWACLVNSASLFEADSAATIDEAVNARAAAVNALAPMLLAQEFLAHARAAQGRRVIQLTDQKLDNLNPDFFSYSTSKAAVDLGARMLAMAQAGPDRIFRLAPGAILASHDQSAEEADRSHRRNLLERRTAAAEVADAALFLATAPLASGQVLHVDSGQHLLAQPRDVIYLEREGAPFP